MSPPDPGMRRGAAANGTPKSQSSSQASTAETNQCELDLQARKLCRLCAGGSFLLMTRPAPSQS